MLEAFFSQRKIHIGLLGCHLSRCNAVDMLDESDKRQVPAVVLHVGQADEQKRNIPVVDCWRIG